MEQCSSLRSLCSRATKDRSWNYLCQGSCYQGRSLDVLSQTVKLKSNLKHQHLEGKACAAPQAALSAARCLPTHAGTEICQYAARQAREIICRLGQHNKRCVWVIERETKRGQVAQNPPIHFTEKQSRSPPATARSARKKITQGAHESHPQNF